MPSAARRAVETGLRVLAFAALAGLLWVTLRTGGQAPAARADGGHVSASLVRWSTREAPGRVHVQLDSAPTPELRDWLAALAGAGTAVTWGGAAPAPSAVAVEPVADPERSMRLWVAAPAGARVVLRDGLGAVDSVVVARGGARLTVPRLEGMLRAASGGAEATAAVRDSLVLRPLLLLGQAGWEAKFTLAALEERGWQVDARLAVAPSGDVRQGPAKVEIDTGRYAAVVVLDSVAVRYAGQIARYVRDGGGLVAAGEAASLRSLAPLMPAASVGTPSLPGVFASDSAGRSPRTALALASLGPLRPGGIALETRPRPLGRQEIAAAAWRVGQGRVVQVGYYDIWRWRLGGVGGDPVRAHRAWWAVLVSGVAYAPRIPLPAPEPLEPTPLASLLSTLGAASPRPPLTRGLLADPRFIPFLFAVLLASLLLEWASRRLRGSR